MKITNLLLLPAAFAALHASASAALINGDFESGVTGFQNYNAGSEFGRTNYTPSFGADLPTGWQREAGTTRLWTTTTTGTGAATFAPELGSYMMRVDANSVQGQNYLFQTVSLASGLYNFAADIFGTAATGAQVEFELVGVTGGAADGITIDIGTFTDNSTFDGLDQSTRIESVSSVTTVGVAGDYEFRFSSPLTNNNHAYVDNVSFDAVPEPSSTALLGLGGLALILRRRK